MASRKIRRLAGIIVGLSVAAFGCGGANDEEDSTEVDSAESAATETNFLPAGKDRNGSGVAEPKEFQPRLPRSRPSGDHGTGVR